MIYLSDADLDRLLLEDIQYGDLTTRSLHIGQQEGRMTLTRKHGGTVSGIEVTRRLLQRLELQVESHVQDGSVVAEGTLLLTAVGKASQLHQGWKVAQNILEWCCGVADYTHQLLVAGRAISPTLQVACTRKSIPGTKMLAVAAILDGGGLIHRAGTAETILLFANHRRFLAQPDDWVSHVTLLRNSAPEKAIVVEADTPEEALAILPARPDIIQLDKFSPAQISALLPQAKAYVPFCHLAATGGVTTANIAEYAATGIDLVITSAPYYSQPADIKVRLFPNN